MTARLLRIAARLMLSVILAAIVGALSVVAVVPRAVHGAALTVLTGSMTPTIPVGSVVVVRPVDPGTLRVGDIITYQVRPGRSEFITHRIVAIHAATKPVTLTTKGDANRGLDTEAVPVTAVRGKVLFHVPYLGTVRSVISTGGAGLLVLLVGLIGYAVTQLISAWRDRRASTAPVLTVAGPADANPLLLQLLAVTLPVAEFGGLLPHQVAVLLRMELLDESAEHFTLAVSREPDQVDELVTFLLPFSPLHVVRSDVLALPSCLDGAASISSVPREPLLAAIDHAA